MLENQNDVHEANEVAKLFSCLSEENQVEFLKFMRALVAENKAEDDGGKKRS